ncbi:MAG: hypothetical protein Edafosvirus39_8, partial [Edafosvirus sp.]
MVCTIKFYKSKNIAEAKIFEDELIEQIDVPPIETINIPSIGTLFIETKEIPPIE